MVGEGDDIEPLKVGVLVFIFGGGAVAGLDADEGSVGFTERQGVAMHHDFHGIAQRGKFHQFDDGVGDEAHVEEVLSALSFAFHCLDAGVLSYFEFI